MQTFLFYDIETTGLNKAFDQVLHFAAIRTDQHLNEIERYELKIKLNPDVIPSPYATITHHIGIKDTANGIVEFDAIKQIHAWLNQPGTMSIGYNTLGFDDEFLRFSFYRNLLPPYTHQFANECGRMDLYPITVMYFLFKNSIIQWPEINGKISLKLEQLNIANRLAEGRAHHAMVDVEATLSLARFFYAEREIWDYLTGYFNKKTDLERLKPLQNSISLLFDGFLGAEQYYHCPVLFLGYHKHYKNQLLWLRLDNEELSKSTLESVTETTHVINKKPGEPSFILPMKERFLQHLSPERKTLAEYNKKWLEQNPRIFSKISAHYSEYKYPVYPETDVSASLYLNGFWTFAEEKFCRQFHDVVPKEKARLAEQTQNPSLQTLTLRLLGRNYPEVLMSSQTEKFNQYLQKINPFNTENALIDYQGRKKLTPKVALSEIAELRTKNQLDKNQLELLTELERYLNDKFVLSSLPRSLPSNALIGGQE